MLENPAVYSATSEKIEVNVTPRFVSEKSNPEQNFYLYKYRIIITNGGQRRVKLLSRCWKIRNGRQKEEVIRGPGVVGKTPELEPFDSFSYESFCPLNTPTGNMRGYFEFIDLETEEIFQVPVPLFFLRIDN